MVTWRKQLPVDACEGHQLEAVWKRSGSGRYANRLVKSVTLRSIVVVKHEAAAPVPRDEDEAQIGSFIFHISSRPSLHSSCPSSFAVFPWPLRTKDTEPVVGKEIQITVCDEEKVVCGVTKHTTCADMVQALLDDHKSIPESKRRLHGDAKNFCLVERWKGLERALPPLTRILRLWTAWGDQKLLIQFVLVKISDFVPQPGKKAKPKGAKPKRYERGGLPHQSLPEERQKRMVKKAFRKLEKLHKAPPRTSPGAEEIDRMVQLILAQDHTLREQGQRMRELDVGIKRSELCAQSRAGAAAAESAACGAPAQTPDAVARQEEEELQRYLQCAGDGVDQLELQVQRHRELIAQLSRDIDLELAAAAGLLWPQGQDQVQDQGPQPEQEGAAAAGPWISDREAQMDSSFYAAELEMVQSELQRSMFAGVSLHYQLSEMDKELKFFDSAMASKDQECWQLASQLSSMQLGCVGEETAGGPGASAGPSPGASVAAAAAKSPARCTVSQATVRLKHSASPTDIADTDSDTGISSTHSQDSLSPCLDFLAPIDTDV
ncbi:Ras association domain-containing protein 9 [Merluccius polli]|uniref:Ras association domain-containing protein 9 n=1 Tax=Merluccius polli TaxID=89951 RepID=A0AA47MY53_MERPO|nr:Ras association domain-containing protein 9 [Merluccius polli]